VRAVVAGRLVEADAGDVAVDVGANFYAQFNRLRVAPIDYRRRAGVVEQFVRSALGVSVAVFVPAL
jgi:hypothetical protein